MKYVHQNTSTNLLAGVFFLSLALPALAASPTSEEKVEDAKQDVAAFARGAKAWSENCFRCHSPRDPKDFRDEQWPVIMQHMRIRAGLTGQETRDILKFMQGSN